MSTRTWHVPRNRSGPRNFVRCRRLLQRREAAIAKVGSPEQLQRDLRGSLAQPRSSATPQKNRGRRKLVFSSLFASQTTRARIRSRLCSEVRSLHPHRCCPRGAPGLVSHPRDPKSDSLLAGAGKNNLTGTAAFGGGRLPSLASLVANMFFLTGVRSSNLRTPYAIPRYIGAKSFFFRELLLLTNSYYSVSKKYVSNPEVQFLFFVAVIS